MSRGTEGQADVTHTNDATFHFTSMRGSIRCGRIVLTKIYHHGVYPIRHGNLPVDVAGRGGTG